MTTIDMHSEGAVDGTRTHQQQHHVVFVPMRRGMAAHCTSVGSRSCISSSPPISSRRSGRSVQCFCTGLTGAARFPPPLRLPLYSRFAAAVARAVIPSCCCCAYLHPICLAVPRCSDERAASASDMCALFRTPLEAAPPPVQRCNSPEDALIQRISPLSLTTSAPTTSISHSS